MLTRDLFAIADLVVWASKVWMLDLRLPLDVALKLGEFFSRNVFNHSDPFLRPPKIITGNQLASDLVCVEYKAQSMHNSN